MIYIESKSKDPYYNLALEEYVFKTLDRTQDFFLLWQNSNTIVIGKYQNTAEEINQAFVDEHDIKVVRRLTGGGAVYHDDGNLNFTFIVNGSADEKLDFKPFVEPIIRALAKLGVDAEFSGRNDLLINGKKISGNSQHISRNRILSHGCIMLDSNIANVSDALKPRVAKYVSKGIKSVRSRVTTINANLQQPVTMDEFKQAILDELLNNNNIQRYKLTNEDITAINALKDEKYSTWEWNYGKSFKYNYQNEHKFEFGFVSVNADIEHGIIKTINIYGDFFGDGDIVDLQNALIGEKLDSTLDKRLDEKIDIGKYIKGMTSENMKNLLR